MEISLENLFILFAKQNVQRKKEKKIHHRKKVARKP